MSSSNSTAELPTICKKADLANAQIRIGLLYSELPVCLPLDNQDSVRQPYCDPDRYWVSKSQVAQLGRARFTLSGRLEGLAP